ncbi:MAG: hypothetical protein ACLSBF_01430 [Alphaproteobacteria bacterium]
MPEPLSGSHDTFSLAATWWLPDWQDSQGSRGSNDIGGGDIVKDDSDCMKHYNLYATCPSPKLSTGVVHPVAGMTCQKSCYCPSEYIYSSSNCAGEYQVSGTACDGKYNACSPKPCTSGGYYAEQQTERICSAVTYGGRTCYSCYQPQCSAGGYETSTKSGYRCSTVAYYGRTCYSCKNDTCPSGYGKSSCGSAYHQTGTAKTEAGSTCYACAEHSYSCPNGTQASSSGMITPVAVSKTCSCGAKSGSCYKEGHSHSYNCPSGYSATNSWGGSAQTAPKTCSCGVASGTCYKAPAHTHSYSCPSGYQASSCSSSQTQTGTTSKVCSCGAASGTCYKCKAKTCTNTCFYTLRSCPANGYCKSCQIIGSDCSVASGGTRYSLVSCHNGTYMSGNSCVSSCGITRCQDLCVRSGKRLDECQRTCNLNPCSYS